MRSHPGRRRSGACPPWRGLRARAPPRVSPSATRSARTRLRRTPRGTVLRPRRRHRRPPPRPRTRRCSPPSRPVASSGAPSGAPSGGVGRRPGPAGGLRPRAAVTPPPTPDPPSALPCTPDPPAGRRPGAPRREGQRRLRRRHRRQPGERADLRLSCAGPGGCATRPCSTRGLSCRHGSLQGQPVTVLGAVRRAPAAAAAPHSAHVWIVHTGQFSGALVALRIHAVVVQFAVVARRRRRIAPRRQEGRGRRPHQALRRLFARG